MQKESVSTQTFIKGVAAAAVVAASLGALNYAEYSTADKGGDHTFVPGSYSASAKGMESDVKVKITVDEHSITDVSVDVSGETDGIGAAIGDEVSSQILAAQSSSIDGVAGASVSSQAVRDALDAAIAKAEKGEADEEAAAEETEAAAQEAATEGTASQETVPAAAGAYVPGTYSASAKGIESDVKVDVTVDESAITDVAVDVSGETAGIGADIGDAVTEQILAAQSAQIDGVAGATITSDAVRTALSDALSQAAATGDSGSEEAVTEGAAEEAVTEAAAEEAAPAAAGSYVPGTYSASAKGLESDVKVDVTVDASSITDVDVDVSGETPGIGAEIRDKVIEQILAAQSAEIEGVTGATVTSGAVKTALSDALSQAAGSGEASAEEAVTEAAAEEAPTETAQAAPAAAGSYVPGAYTGTAQGLESEVKVTVTVSEDSITSVGIDVSGETAGIGAEVGPELSKSILTSQSAEIDGVAGATVTSGAVKDALAAALAKAAGGDSAAEEVPAEAAQETAAEPVEETATEAVEEAPAETAQAAPAAAGSYVPGTYAGTAQGLESEVSVAVSVSEDSITAVGIDVSGETDGIGAEVGPELSKAILAAQSAEIDGVAGATVTSGAVKDALAVALAKAAGGESTAEAAEEEATEAVEVAVTEAAKEAVAEGTVEASTEEAMETQSEPADAKQDVPVVSGSYVPGTYIGTAQGLDSIVKVMITVSENAITSVGMNVSGETEGIGAEVGPEMCKAILAAQSAEIDGVAGATVTSDAVKAALTSALVEAAGGNAQEEPVTEAVEELMSTEAEEILAEAAVTDAEGTAGTYVPGIYTAAAQGMDSNVQVSISFSETAMTAVAVNVSGETEGIGAEVGPALSKAILSAQSGDIDAVAGATITSGAVSKAAEECIKQAQS